MNPFKLFLPSYLFNPVPGYYFMYFWPLLILFVLLFSFSFKAKKYLASLPNKEVNLKLLGGIPSRMREFALIGLLLTLLRNENIPYLGMRIWLVLLFIVMAAYIAYLAWNWQKNFHVKIIQQKKQVVTDKYRPQAKKKKRKKRR